MNFKQIHTLAPRGSQAVLTGSTGMLTVRSSQKGPQSLSGVFQSRFQGSHQGINSLICISRIMRARMANRSSNIAIADPQSVLRAAPEPSRCQDSLKRSECLQRAPSMLYKIS